MKQNQENMTKRLVLLLFVAATLAMGVTACHTVHGAGEDISTAGNKIQEHTPP
jgi:predicted small secreted protein